MILGSLDPKVLAANQCQYLLTTDSTLKWLQQEMENNIAELVIILINLILFYVAIAIIIAI